MCSHSGEVSLHRNFHTRFQFITGITSHTRRFTQEHEGHPPVHTCRPVREETGWRRGWYSATWTPNTIDKDDEEDDKTTTNKTEKKKKKTTAMKRQKKDENSRDEKKTMTTIRQQRTKKKTQEVTATNRKKRQRRFKRQQQRVQKKIK